jgi:hypothetical protein
MLYIYITIIDSSSSSSSSRAKVAVETVLAYKIMKYEPRDVLLKSESVI